MELKFNNSAPLSMPPPTHPSLHHLVFPTCRLSASPRLLFSVYILSINYNIVKKIWVTKQALTTAESWILTCNFEGNIEFSNVKVCFYEYVVSFYAFYWSPIDLVTMPAVPYLVVFAINNSVYDLISIDSVGSAQE